MTACRHSCTTIENLVLDMITTISEEDGPASRYLRPSGQYLEGSRSLRAGITRPAHKQPPNLSLSFLGPPPPAPPSIGAAKSGPGDSESG